MQAFVTRNELVGEAKTGHETTLLEPKDGTKGTRKENALDGRKRNAAFGKRGIVARTPLQGPVGLLLDARNGVDGRQQVSLFGRVTNVRVDEQRVGLGVNVFHGNLKAVKAASFGRLNLRGKVLGQVFIDNAIRGREKGKDMGNKVAFVAREIFPVLQVRGKVNFFGRPETRFGLFDKAVRVFFEEGFVKFGGLFKELVFGLHNPVGRRVLGQVFRRNSRRIIRGGVGDDNKLGGTLISSVVHFPAGRRHVAHVGGQGKCFFGRFDGRIGNLGCRKRSVDRHDVLARRES
eukprot:scaffold15_cov204-Amphora_coffeaeformis.AAC.14